MTEVVPLATCPCCGERDQVERVGHPVGDFWCGRCNLVFAGSEAEWHRGRLGNHALRDWRRNGGKRPVEERGGNPM